MRVIPFASSCVLVLAAACASRDDAPPPRAPAGPPQPLLARIGADVASSAPVPAAVDAGAADASPASDAPPGVRDLQRAILASHGAADAVASITMDVGPRLVGSPGDKLALAWAEAAMKARGLSNVHREKVMARRWERGAESASIVAPVAQKLAITTLGWSGATPAGGIEGDVVRFDSLDALRKADTASIARRIVFLDVPMRRSADGDGYGDAVPARMSGPLEAAKRGAAAIVIRSIGTDHGRAPHTGATRFEDAKTAIPAGALSVADAELLARVLATHGKARLALTLTPRWLPDVETANVVGEAPGRDKPDEVVVLGAHLDSWDLAQGAIDDGAGCGIVLEAARAIAAAPVRPRRTVRVVLFAGEESSGAGSREYAKAHAAEAAKIVAAMEADLGTGRVTTLRFLGDKAMRDRVRAVAAAVAPLGIRSDDEPAGGGADLRALRALGVPLFDLDQDATRYFDIHHTANDTYEQIDADALAQASAAFASTAWVIADGDDGFGRVPEDDRDGKH
jgi:hypothetical protein